MWSTFRQQLPNLLVFALAAAGIWALVTGRLQPAWNDGRPQVGVRLAGARTLTLPLHFAEGWTIALCVFVALWAAAEAVLRSEWTPGLDPLIPVIFLGALCGFLLAKSPLNALAYALAGLELGFIAVVWLTYRRAGGGGDAHAAWAVWWPVQQWLAEFWRPGNWSTQMGLMGAAWVTGLWTSWWVFRQRRAVLALIPSAVIIAVDVLNDPTHPVLYFLVILWLAAALGLLLRLNYVILSRRWRARRVPRAADTAWGFGEISFQATGALLLVAFLLPPLNQQDLSSFLVPPDVAIANFGRSLGLGYGNSGTRGGLVETGFSDNVRPAGPIRRNTKVVMEISGADSASVLYWHGAALGSWDGRAWKYLSTRDNLPVAVETNHASGRVIARVGSETQPRAQQALTSKVAIKQRGLQTLFGGGEIEHVEGVVAAIRGVAPDAPRGVLDTAQVDGRTQSVHFATVDDVRVSPRARVPEQYTVTARASNADVQSLRTAGTDYPAWLAPFIQLYARGSAVTPMQRANDDAIARLAGQVVAEAGATNPYDRAKAIETYLRNTEGSPTAPLSRRPFTYDLETPAPPGAERAVDYFLLRSHQGYCEYFASAMGAMLRHLGLPTRVVSGFGKGQYEDRRGSYVVRAQDAHTWVEVYFPGYGWVEFEPTPDPNYPAIDRPSAPATDSTETGTTGSTASANPREREPDPGLTDQGAGGGAIQVAARGLYLPALALLVLGALSLLALRFYLAVSDPGRIWRRLLLLGRRYRVPQRAADTPLEFGQRLATAVPSIGPPVRELAWVYTRSCFRQEGLTSEDEGTLGAAWSTVRRRYLLLLWHSLRPA
jgi:transglutaminase-like putative cysteine protease